MPTLADLRAKAQAHQDSIDRDTRFFDVGTLAKRWGVSPTTVRAIPQTLLPYLNVGTGLQRERRRYHPDDVARYESARLPKAG
jgi:hypothetical protein